MENQTMRKTGAGIAVGTAALSTGTQRRRRFVPSVNAVVLTLLVLLMVLPILGLMHQNKAAKQPATAVETPAALE